MSKGFNLLARLLSKRGITKPEDLTPDESKVYDNYRRILTGETLTVETIKAFIQNQIRLLEEQFGKKETTHDAWHKASIHIYLTLLRAIEAPEKEREVLERHLVQIIEEP